MQYGLGQEKGGVGGRDADGNIATITNNPWMLGKMTRERAEYTGERVVETVEEVAGGSGVELMWQPVNIAKDAAGKHINIIVKDTAGNVLVEGVNYTVDDSDPKHVKIANGGVAYIYKVGYIYDNVVVPQDKLPTFVGQMKNIAVAAKVRRIAVMYSQIAAFQAKNDYGLDFESVIAQQAQAELSYEIDAEAVYMLKDAADKAVAEGRIAEITWIDEELDTISYSMKAEGFARKIEQAKMEVYKRTNRFQPNWMLVSPDMMPILTFVPGFKAASANAANGPFIGGEIGGMKVIVSPALGAKVCYLGILGADGKTAVGYYMPYMPIVPTQLLGFADGAMEQGFSSVYAMGMINDELMVKITVTSGDDAALIKVLE